MSASHLDWTMVPYVRKSFYKHYMDGMQYIESIEVAEVKYSEVKDSPIDDKTFYCHAKAYDYAMAMTEKELKQAVEGLFHNLNTL